MHNALVAACFLLLILVPCIVAMRSSSKEGETGNSGEHKTPNRQRGHTPSRLREAANIMAARKQARLDAANSVVVSTTAEQPSHIGTAVNEGLTRPVEDVTAISDTTLRPSRIRMMAAALTQRKPKGPVPMAGGDPGAKKLSIKELRARQATARIPRS